MIVWVILLTFELLSADTLKFLIVTRTVACWKISVLLSRKLVIMRWSFFFSWFWHYSRAHAAISTPIIIVLLILFAILFAWPKIEFIIFRPQRVMIILKMWLVWIFTLIRIRQIYWFCINHVSCSARSSSFELISMKRFSWTFWYFSKLVCFRKVQLL